MISDDIEELQHSAKDGELSSQVSSIPIPRISKRPKQSDIHSQCQQISKNNALYWKCKYCSQEYKQSAGTKNMRDHLVKTHGWDGLSSTQLKRKREDQEISEIIKRVAPHQPTRRLDSQTRDILTRFTDKQTLEYLYVEYVVTCDIPFL